MTPGRGSRFRFGDFTLFVEVREEGWIASIRDHTLKAWQSVDITWETYGENAN